MGGGGGGQCQPWIDRAEWLFKKRFMENRTSTTQGFMPKVIQPGKTPSSQKQRWWLTFYMFPSLEPGPTWLLIVLGCQEGAWGPVKIDHYSSRC